LLGNRHKESYSLEIVNILLHCTARAKGLVILSKGLTDMRRVGILEEVQKIWIEKAWRLKPEDRSHDQWRGL
jgi:hypothetical protein